MGQNYTPEFYSANLYFTLAFSKVFELYSRGVEPPIRHKFQFPVQEEKTFGRGMGGYRQMSMGAWDPKSTP